MSVLDRSSIAVFSDASVVAWLRAGTKLGRLCSGDSSLSNSRIDIHDNLQVSAGALLWSNAIFKEKRVTKGTGVDACKSDKAIHGLFYL